jgi:hypothetical protein
MPSRSHNRCAIQKKAQLGKDFAAGHTARQPDALVLVLKSSCPMPAIYARGSLRPAGGCASLCGARRGHVDNVWRVSEAHIGGKN